MRVGLAADHEGFALKQRLEEALQIQGYQTRDYGAWELNPTDDYPDFVFPLAEGVVSHEVDRGIAICGSGVGACIAANKVKGIRACLVHEHYAAHQGVEHDDLNLLCIGSLTTGEGLALELVLAFLQTNYIHVPRHERRLQKIAQYEEKASAGSAAFARSPVYPP